MRIFGSLIFRGISAKIFAAIYRPPLQILAHFWLFAFSRNSRLKWPISRPLPQLAKVGGNGLVVGLFNREFREKASSRKFAEICRGLAYTFLRIFGRLIFRGIRGEKGRFPGPFPLGSPSWGNCLEIGYFNCEFRGKSGVRKFAKFCRGWPQGCLRRFAPKRRFAPTSQNVN